ncbi:MAG: zf-HC2 domain-containing protein [Caldilineaceae bacterium]|nr:zf-HC2 domain-containing protein [Caldilineaceae bacterium]
MAEKHNRAGMSPGKSADHGEYLMLISLALDGMLDPAEKEQLDGHLEQCSGCRAQWLLWQAIDDRLRAAPVPVPAPGFSRSVAQRLAQQERLRNLRIGVMLTAFTLLVWSLGLVGVCVLTCALVYTNLDRLADTGLFLNEVWAVAGIVGHSLWEIIVEITATPAALGVASAYLVIAVAAIAVWCIIIQRTTQPLHSRG